ncbi:MAG: hypothetical protein Q8O92_01405 [Candidatus Latescibacter sp.]|nr:hypothetical protein [Candidatus Latescibacter sp.]
MMRFIPLFCLGFLLSSSPFCAETASPFFIGAIRSDGVLIPFALYDSGKWSSPWPSYFNPDFPSSPSKILNDSTITTLSKIPTSWSGSQKTIPTRWWKLGTKGDSLFTVSKPVIIPSYCVKLWALLLSGRKPPLNTHAYVPFNSIAASARLPLSQIISIRPDSPEWKELLLLVESMVKKKEAGKGSTFSEKEKVVIKMNISIIRNELPFHDEYYYYYEVEKLSHILESDKRYRCKTLNGEGWIRKNQTGELAVMKKENYGTSEFFIPDINNYIFHNNDIPWGMLVLQNKMYWIIDRPGYESESCVIYQVDQMGITKVIDFYLGGC